MVWEAYRAVKIPVIGMVSIMTGRDAIEFILAGATAVAVGPANFIWPDATMRVIEEIKDYMHRHNIDDINTLIGGLIWEQ
jgi:dihydroorotate dehydrogenase (NAD+) catalytic subunit